jgi:hypothetical protein
MNVFLPSEREQRIHDKKAYRVDSRQFASLLEGKVRSPGKPTCDTRLTLPVNRVKFMCIGKTVENW